MLSRLLISLAQIKVKEEALKALFKHENNLYEH